MENVIREVLNEWLVRELPDLIEREYKVKISDRILAIIGPRRAGKTYFMFQMIKKLLNEGYEKENIVYVDFDDIRLSNLREENYSTFLKVVHELFKERGGRIFLFLDEVQNLKKWERWIRTLHNSGKFYIIVSGSSSKLLSKEVATQLRGRYVSKIILPFSFREFLKAKGVKLEYLDAPEVRGRILRYLREYLEFGGFPEVVLEDDEGEKIRLLKVYKETIFYRDIVERHRIRDISGFETFMKVCIESFGKYLSLSKVHNYFRSIGIRKSKRTLWNYLKYLEQAFFLFTLEKFAKVRERVAQPRKVYASDVGFFNLSEKVSKEIGIRMENVLFLELLRRTNEKPFLDIYYFKDYQGHEVDFLVKERDRVKELVNVTYANSFDEIDKREYRNLLKAYDLLKKDKPELKIITWDYEDEREISWFGRRGRIKFVPLWKYILQYP